MNIHIRQATPTDLPVVTAILREAADWLQERGDPLWLDNDLLPDEIAEHVDAGLYFLAESDGEPAGTFRFQRSDPDFWPDIPEGDSAFIHRLAVRRRYAGKGVSHEMLRFAVERARALGCTHLRLDCDASRPRLRALYEGFGFRHHSDRDVTRLYVARYELEL